MRSLFYSNFLIFLATGYEQTVVEILQEMIVPPQLQIEKLVCYGKQSYPDKLTYQGSYTVNP